MRDEKESKLLTSIPTSVYIGAVYQRAAALRDLVSEFRIESLRYTSEHFVKGIQTVLDAIERFHQNRMLYLNKFSANPEFQDEQQRFFSKLALDLLAEVHQKYLPLLYSGKQQSEHWILPSLRRAIAVFDPSVELSLIPTYDFNYVYDGGMENFVEDTISKLENHLDAANKGVMREGIAPGDSQGRKITFIQFPLGERGSALNLVILTHEVAHLVDQIVRVFDGKELKLEPESYNRNFEEFYHSPVSSEETAAESQLTFESVFTRETLEPEFRTNCLSCSRSWIREAIADLIAANAMGPAYFFALSELFAHSARENRPSSTHPAPAFRMNLVLEELAYLGYFDAATAQSNVLDRAQKAVTSTSELQAVRWILEGAFVKVARDKETIRYGSVTEVGATTLDTYLERVRDKVHKYLLEYSFAAEKYEKEVPPIVEALLEGIPPIERKDTNGAALKFIPNSIQAIVNGGWHVYQTRMGEFDRLFADHIPAQSRLASFNQLLFKAVEGSEVIRLWNKTSR
jgi:hypothetical protein